MADVHKPDHAGHGFGIVQLERVVERERVDVDDIGLEAGVEEERDLVLDQLTLGRHEQHRHLQPLVHGVEDLEIELHALHVEGHVLLGLPADHLAGIGLLHPIHLDPLDDDVAAADRGHHLLLFHPRRLEERANGAGDQRGVHDLALHDRIGDQRRGGCLDDPWPAFAVLHDHELDVPATDVESYGPLAAAQSDESHNVSKSWVLKVKARSTSCDGESEGD